MDLIHSESTKNYPYYDYAKVNKLAKEYYSGNYGLAKQLDWFLSLELFRRNISQNWEITLELC